MITSNVKVFSSEETSDKHTGEIIPANNKYNDENSIQQRNNRRLVRPKCRCL